MALLFSHVRVSTPDGNETEFLVSGIPRELEDFDYYTKFEDFLDSIEEDRAKPTKPALRKWHTSISECRKTRIFSPVTATTLNLLTSPAITLPMNYSGWIGGDRDRNVLRHAPRSYRTL